MVHKISSIILVTVIAIILVSVPAIWIFSPAGWVERNLEGRNLNVFPKITIADVKRVPKRILQGNFAEAGRLVYGAFSGKSFQSQMESASSDQFPFRLNLTMFAESIERGMIRIAYLPFDDVAIPAGIKERIMVLRSEPILFYIPNAFTPDVQKTIDLCIENYKDLIERYSNVNFFVYYIDRINNSVYHPAAKYFPQADKGQGLIYFEQHKPEKLVLGKLMLNSFEDHRKYYFKTDHHWNMQGAWMGYEGVYKMMAPYYPEIGPMLKPKRFATVPGVNFCGSYARQSLYPCQPDSLEYVDVDLPPYETFVDGVKKPYGRREDYLAGKASLDEYASHYGEFFGNDFSLVEYHFSNKAERNLLLIGSSFTQEMEVYIASHYHNTYAIDLRHYKDFSLGEMIRKYQIDDVLALDTTIVFNSPVWFIKP
jgi:hypothetical protein